MNIAPPAWADDERLAIEHQIATTGQDDRSILALGLWNIPTPHRHVRVFAGYRYLHAHPDDHAAWLQLAEAHRELGEYGPAESILQALGEEPAPDLFPQVFFENLSVHRALLMADQNRPNEALTLLDQQEEMFTDHPLFHYTRGSVFHAQNDFSEAISEYDHALACLEVYLSEAEILDDATDYEGVAAAITKQKTNAEEEAPFTGHRPADMAELAHEPPAGDDA